MKDGRVFLIRWAMLDDAAFFGNLRHSLGIGISDAQFLEGWNAIFTGVMPGIAPLLSRAAAKIPLYAFSNTNPPHVAHFSKTYADVLGHFREIYLSSSIGLRKPEVAAYQHVVNAIVSLARAFDLATIAEGVEDAEALALLQRAGVDYAQGLHLGPPLPIERY